MKRIAIIGAGIAGLHLACRLGSSASVTVFEKARGVGGRMSTRYAEPFTFDHGAQHFTARTAEFRNFLAPWIKRGVVQLWNPNMVILSGTGSLSDKTWSEPHYVACPNMNSLCKEMAREVDARTSVEVAPLTLRGPDGWALTDATGQLLGSYDWVISTAPHVQTARLFETVLDPKRPLPVRNLQPCYCFMLGLALPWPHHWHAAIVNNSPISWIALNNSKTGRSSAPSLVVHADAAWSAQHLEDAPHQVESALLDELRRLGIFDGEHFSYRSLHRWRYAKAPESMGDGPYIDDTLGLAAAGDWTGTGRVEDAWMQAELLSQHILSA